MVATCPEIWAMPNGTADLVGRFPAGEDAADIGERAVDHEPGLLDAEPQRGRRIDALGQGLAGRGRAGDAQNALRWLLPKVSLTSRMLRRRLQLKDRIAALDR